MAQLTVEVQDAGNGQVHFIFRNAGPNASSICDVYFDDGTLLENALITNSSAGVAYSITAKPGNLPGGNAISFNTSSPQLAADSDPPVQPNGVNPGEFVRITFDLKSGKSFASIESALQLSLDNPGVDMTDGLRIGIHVQGFANGGSESFVNGPPPPQNILPVPEPASLAIWSLGMGLAGLGARRLRKKV
jgi:hypothetical protein